MEFEIEDTQTRVTVELFGSISSPSGRRASIDTVQLSSHLHWN